MPKTLLLDRTQTDIAGEIIKQGGLVAFPTETVYGLGANALDENAVRSIYTAKGRPSDNPLIVHISDIKMLNELVSEVPQKARMLMDKFWPGPLTIIMKKTENVPYTVSGGLETVAVRMPNNEIALSLIESCGLPVAAPSANTSGKPSPTAAQYVIDDMMGKIDAIIDGGACSVGLESTVLDMSGDIPALLRPGGVTYEQLTEVLGTVEKKFQCKEGETPRSPGMKYKHYAPNAPVYVMRGDYEGIINEFCEKYDKIGVLCHSDININKNCIAVKTDNSPGEYAKNLFSAMRDLDKKGAAVILAEDVDDTGINLATKNRLYRAAAHKIYEKSK